MTTPTDRRSFLAAATATTTAATVAVSASDHTAQKYPKLVHHVFFWLKNPRSTVDRDRLLAGLRALEKIETVRGAHFGVPASTEKRDVVDNSYSVSEILFFDDVAGQNAYQEHPIHKQFIAECAHLWDKVVVYDTLAV